MTPGLSVHYYFGTRFWTVLSNKIPQTEGLGIGFASRCAENWIYGSEVAVIVDAANPPSQIVDIDGVFVQNDGDVRMFGSTVRIVTAPVTANQAGAQLRGVVAGAKANLLFLGNTEKGTFHMHGGIISGECSGLARREGYRDGREEGNHR